MLSPLRIFSMLFVLSLAGCQSRQLAGHYSTGLSKHPFALDIFKDGTYRFEHKFSDSQPDCGKWWELRASGKSQPFVHPPAYAVLMVPDDKSVPPWFVRVCRDQWDELRFSRDARDVLAREDPRSHSDFSGANLPFQLTSRRRHRSP
jgi:hypothetical protein